MKGWTAEEMVAGNHDLHLHSRHYSDGWHDFDEVVRFGLRWQEGERWLGLSDHSPRLEDAVTMEESFREYVKELRGCLPELSRRHQAEVLVGVELDWLRQGPSLSSTPLAQVDYVLAGYHAPALDGPEQARELLLRMARHPDSDVIAHPDRFLGDFPPGQLDWPEIFEEMRRQQVICEYNLVTPLADELLEAALSSGVEMVIGSDMHDHRRRAVERLVAAWAESCAGGFELARSFLGSIWRDRRLEALADTPARLAAFEGRVYARTRRLEPVRDPLSRLEEEALEALDHPDGDEADRQFLTQRLRRLEKLPRQRLVSMLGLEAFRSRLAAGRAARGRP